MRVKKKINCNEKNIKIKLLSPKTFLKEKIYDKIKDISNIKKKNKSYI